MTTTTGEPAAVRGRKAEQSDRTRGALIQVARTLFAERGYAATPTEEVVQLAGVTRGALYHHFRDKQDLFEAVFIDVQEEGRLRIREAFNSESDPWEAFRAGFQEYLNYSMDPTVQRIMLLDAPSVLGWDRWREIDYSLELLQNGLAVLREHGIVADDVPLDELAHVLRGVANEASHLIASSTRVGEARARVGVVVDLILQGVRAR
jgi:AcrR family transcriptional regulator